MIELLSNYWTPLLIGFVGTVGLFMTILFLISLAAWFKKPRIRLTVYLKDSQPVTLDCGVSLPWNRFKPTDEEMKRLSKQFDALSTVTDGNLSNWDGRFERIHIPKGENVVAIKTELL